MLNILARTAVALTLLVSAQQGLSQAIFANNSTDPTPAFEPSSSSITDSDLYGGGDSPSTAATGYVRLPPTTSTPSKPYRPFTRAGIDWHSGLGGVGFDMATPLAKKFNVRTGFDFFSYSTSFQEQGANIGAALKMRSGHASLDWFPFGGRFRVSPDLVYANSNQVKATALIPSGSNVTLNGQNFVSSSTDPLHGSGSITFRKTAPGLTLGFGDIIPRSKGHVTFPIEAGFYYVNQPQLHVAFSGTACDPNYSSSVGCMSVDADPGFQQALSAFTARNEHNLSYASFLPILSIGVGYSF